MKYTKLGIPFDDEAIQNDGTLSYFYYLASNYEQHYAVILILSDYAIQLTYNYNFIEIFVISRIQEQANFYAESFRLKYSGDQKLS